MVLRTRRNLNTFFTFAARKFWRLFSEKCVGRRTESGVRSPPRCFVTAGLGFYGLCLGNVELCYSERGGTNERNISFRCAKWHDTFFQNHLEKTRSREFDLAVFLYYGGAYVRESGVILWERNVGTRTNEIIFPFAAQKDGLLFSKTSLRNSDVRWWRLTCLGRLHVKRALKENWHNDEWRLPVLFDRVLLAVEFRLRRSKGLRPLRSLRSLSYATALASTSLEHLFTVTTLECFTKMARCARIVSVGVTVVIINYYYYSLRE